MESLDPLLPDLLRLIQSAQVSLQMFLEHLLCAEHCSRAYSGEQDRSKSLPCRVCISVGTDRKKNKVRYCRRPDGEKCYGERARECGAGVVRESCKEETTRQEKNLKGEGANLQIPGKGEGRSPPSRGNNR